MTALSSACNLYAADELLIGYQFVCRLQTYYAAKHSIMEVSYIRYVQTAVAQVPTLEANRS